MTNYCMYLLSFLYENETRFLLYSISNIASDHLYADKTLEQWRKLRFFLGGKMLYELTKILPLHQKCDVVYYLR